MQKRTLLCISVLAFLTVSILTAEETWSASASTMTKEDEENLKKTREQWRKAVDIDVSLEREVTGSRKRSYSSAGSGYYRVPDGKLIFFNSTKICNLSKSEPLRNLRSLRVGLLKEDDQTENWFAEEMKKPDSLVRAGYVSLYGKQKAEETLAKISDGKSILVCDTGAMLFRDAGYLAQNNCPLTEDQKQKIITGIKEQQACEQAFYMAYQKCRKELTDGHIRLLFEAFDIAQSLKQENNKLGLTLFTPEQKRAIRRMWVESGPFASSGMTDFASMRISGSKGSFTCSLKIRHAERAEKCLSYFLEEICDTQLGKLVLCSIDDTLKRKSIKVDITFRSIEDGLDRLAKLAGGHLVKHEDGSYAILQKSN